MLSKLTTSTKYSLIRLFLGCIMTAAMVGIFFYQPYFTQQNDRIIYDIYLRTQGGGTPSPTPAIIDIDEASLEAHGQWPWPRHLVAKLLKNITESGAAAIGLDIIFAEADRTSPREIQEVLKEHFNVDLGFTGLPQMLHDNDKLLATIMRQSPLVLGSYVRFSQDTKLKIPKNLPHFEGVFDRVPPAALEPRALLAQGQGLTLPLEDFYAVAPIASLNVAPDPDGLVRAIPLIFKVQDRIVLSLGLRALMRGLGLKTIALEGGPYGLEAINIGKYRVPVSPSGLFYVPFRGPSGTYPYFSAKDILSGSVPAEELQGRVLLIGTSAPGLYDIRATPFDPIYPGVESHAAIIDAILSQKSLSLPLWTPLVQLSSVIVVGIISTLLFGLAPAIVYLPLFMGLCLGGVYASWYTFTQGIFISPQYALLTIISIMILLLGARFWQENRQKRQLRRAFSRYVSPEMVKRISEKGEVLLTGEEREVTLIFTDVRGFTTISEKLSPAQIVSMLNMYFTPMTRLIQQSSGTVDKFVGDAIMAFWNAPLDVAEHESKALHTAIRMHEELEKLNIVLREKYDVTIRIGGGLHTGKVHVGNMGSEELLDYTCIGDTVNLASRIESLCSTYGVGILLSSVTAEQCCAQYQAREMQSNEEALSISMFTAHEHKDTQHYLLPLDAINVKGKTEPVEIYTVLSRKEVENSRAEFVLFLQAQEQYKQGNFFMACELFQELQEKAPSRAFYTLFADRSQHLLENTPRNWNGVWTFTKK